MGGEITQDQINDLLHALWGAWACFCIYRFHPVLAVFLIILPREAEQFYHAFDAQKLLTIDFWYWKARDMLGFVIGAWGHKKARSWQKGDQSGL